MPHDRQTWHCRGGCGYRTANSGRWCRWCMDGVPRPLPDYAGTGSSGKQKELPPGETMARLRRMVGHRRRIAAEEARLAGREVGEAKKWANQHR